MSNEIQKTDEKAMEFVPYGAQDKIKLTLNIIKNLIAVPTRSGKVCSDKEAMKFMMLCQARRLNPFEGDCFLIGYDNQDGVASFSLITAHQAFLKRAEIHPEYDGMKSGIIVQEEDGKLIDMEGDFHTPEQVVVGGWATVFFKNRKIPTTRRIRMSRFNKGRAQWKEDAAGMICKCAEADALRSSFPTMLGGLFMRDEVEISLGGNETMKNSPTFVAVAAAEAPQVQGQESHPELEPAKAAPAKPATNGSPVKELSDYITGEGFTFNQFVKWAGETGQIDNADSLGSFDEVPEAIAKRLLRAKAGLLKGLQMVREVESK